MGDSLITIIGIFLAAILMFVFPLVAVSERSDDISQLAVQTATAEFVNEVRTKGVITTGSYDKFMQQLVATGNSYNVELEVQRLDENPGKKTTSLTSKNKIGENIYYSEYTSQIEQELASTGKCVLKEGDRFAATVKNTNTTIAQILRSFFYRISGDSTYEIAASHSGIIISNGK